MFKKTVDYINQYGLLKFVKKVPIFLASKIKQKLFNYTNVVPLSTSKIDNWYYSRFPNLLPLRVFTTPPNQLRINLVTDSINSGSLYGGVATAIILSALLAESKNANLRIITRTEIAKKNNFFKVLKANNINYSENVDFPFANIYDQDYEIDISSQDVFLTTSWWTTWSTLKSIPPEKIIYLLQEDERMFYPYGDEHLLCSQILSNKQIKFVVNTQLLMKHFNLENLSNIELNGISFEPSFPNHSHNLFDNQNQKNKNKFLFYARPNNYRNLFYLGLKVIEDAVLKGIFDDSWEFIFVGKDIPVEMISKLLPSQSSTFYENLSWSEYVELIRSIDLGFSLMYTPHPSYPPLDLAAVGAVVVTNEFGVKKDLAYYSKNIICKQADFDSLLEGLIEGITLSQNYKLRKLNFDENNILKDWRVSFESVLMYLKEI